MGRVKTELMAFRLPGELAARIRARAGGDLTQTDVVIEALQAGLDHVSPKFDFKIHSNGLPAIRLDTIGAGRASGRGKASVKTPQRPFRAQLLKPPQKRKERQ